MHQCVEDYCKKCGERFDPIFGCRCSLVPIADESQEYRQLRLSVRNFEPVLASRWLASLVTVQ